MIELIKYECGCGIIYYCGESYMRRPSWYNTCRNKPYCLTYQIGPGIVDTINNTFTLKSDVFIDLMDILYDF